MKEEVKNQWVAALRSGKYKKGIGKLKTLDGEFCCLGVLCDISGLSEWVTRSHGLPGCKYYEEIAYLPPSVQEWSGMQSDRGEYENEKGNVEDLSYLNDYGGKSLIDIANIIEENWGKL